MYEKTGKKLYNTDERTDWTRLGVGGPKEAYNIIDQYANTSTESIYYDNDKLYKTTNSSKYPELIYEPSKPVVRAMAGDADVAFAEKDKIRKARYARKSKNLGVTLTRIEYETLEAECREKRRVQIRAQDMLRYDSSNLLGGLVGFKKQPTQLVSRKQHPEMFDKMFVGQVTLGNMPRNAPDERDFSTTSGAEYAR